MTAFGEMSITNYSFYVLLSCTALNEMHQLSAILSNRSNPSVSLPNKKDLRLCQAFLQDPGDCHQIYRRYLGRPVIATSRIDNMMAHGHFSLQSTRMINIYVKRSRLWTSSNV